eukprot:Lithocolla_globosa_v1_NODE_6955_length_1010_cov_78.957068.p2 type:complete len:146 gc:universal NODE_6955_length_1010_cov_78.957068:361-798(+)
MVSQPHTQGTRPFFWVPHAGLKYHSHHVISCFLSHRMVKLGLTIVVTVSLQLLHVCLCDEHDDQARFFNSGCHFFDNVSFHSLLVKPGDKSKRRQILVHLTHTLVRVSSQLVFGPSVCQKCVVRIPFSTRCFHRYVFFRLFIKFL